MGNIHAGGPTKKNTQTYPKNKQYEERVENCKRLTY